MEKKKVGRPKKEKKYEKPYACSINRPGYTICCKVFADDEDRAKILSKRIMKTFCGKAIETFDISVQEITKYRRAYCD